jgi:predicted MFS family arabinose efflux permease
MVLNRILLPEKMSELEKANLDQQISQAIMNVDLSIIQKQPDVVMAEAQGESWLQRNWRPILMLTIVAIVANNYVVAPYIQLFFSKGIQLELPEKLWSLLQIGVGGYVIGRSAEKIAESKWGSK